MLPTIVQQDQSIKELMEINTLGFEILDETLREQTKSILDGLNELYSVVVDVFDVLEQSSDIEKLTQLKALEAAREQQLADDATQSQPNQQSLSNMQNDSKGFFKGILGKLIGGGALLLLGGAIGSMILNELKDTDIGKFFEGETFGVNSGVAFAGALFAAIFGPGFFKKLGLAGLALTIGDTLIEKLLTSWNEFIEGDEFLEKFKISDEAIDQIGDIVGGLLAGILLLAGPKVLAKAAVAAAAAGAAAAKKLIPGTGAPPPPPPPPPGGAPPPPPTPPRGGKLARAFRTALKTGGRLVPAVSAGLLISEASELIGARVKYSSEQVRKDEIEKAQNLAAEYSIEQDPEKKQKIKDQFMSSVGRLQQTTIGVPQKIQQLAETVFQQPDVSEIDKADEETVRKVISDINNDFKIFDPRSKNKNEKIEFLKQKSSDLTELTKKVYSNPELSEQEKQQLIGQIDQFGRDLTNKIDVIPSRRDSETFEIYQKMVGGIGTNVSQQLEQIQTSPINGAESQQLDSGSGGNDRLSSIINPPPVISLEARAIDQQPSSPVVMINNNNNISGGGGQQQSQQPIIKVTTSSGKGGAASARISTEAPLWRSMNALYQHSFG